ncbi:MAG: hypothetical protein HY700_16595 [Gemmatimonadetes bacterium]|nr:hypothetical protein [Gemmatimonadota bacterium]
MAGQGSQDGLLVAHSHRPHRRLPLHLSPNREAPAHLVTAAGERLVQATIPHQRAAGRAAVPPVS